MSTESGVRVLAAQPCFRNEVFEVRRESVRLASGLRQDLAIVRHPGAVAIAARLENGDLLLVSQYRHAAGKVLEEIPAGRLDPGEEPLEAARRELEEETGHRARSWTLLASFLPAPGFCSERLVLYLAEDLEPVPGGGRDGDADEEIGVVHRSPVRILDGSCEDAKTLVAACALLLGEERFRRPS